MLAVFSNRTAVCPSCSGSLAPFSLINLACALCFGLEVAIRLCSVDDTWEPSEHLTTGVMPIHTLPFPRARRDHGCFYLCAVSELVRKFDAAEEALMKRKTRKRKKTKCDKLLNPKKRLQTPPAAAAAAAAADSDNDGDDDDDDDDDDMLDEEELIDAALEEAKVTAAEAEAAAAALRSGAAEAAEAAGAAGEAAEAAANDSGDDTESGGSGIGTVKPLWQSSYRSTFTKDLVSKNALLKMGCPKALAEHLPQDSNHTGKTR